ncbi:hypothetical protein F2P81_025336 [Scophthalmus maximus]|uniref:Uncharacterized protein n=1 Tax=Scophthalmus maximus TaxID=52904 RepID=A0A6A4RV81_SCOMX|nr:hypothetical protein F2P81_025336 [Scophthalmus maximus]
MSHQIRLENMATSMFKNQHIRLEVGVAEAWDRLKKAGIDNATAAQLPTEDSLQSEAEVEGEGDDEVEEDQAGRNPRGAHKMSALEQLFEDEDRELFHATQTTSSALSITEQVQKEIEIYKGLPAIPSGQDPVDWWWEWEQPLLIMNVNSATRRRILRKLTNLRKRLHRCFVAALQLRIIIFLIWKFLFNVAASRRKSRTVVEEEPPRFVDTLRRSRKCDFQGGLS